MSKDDQDRLEQLAAARDRVRVNRRDEPPFAQPQPTYVFLPQPPASSGRVSADASAFRWGFGLTFGAPLPLGFTPVLVGNMAPARYIGAG